MTCVRFFEHLGKEEFLLAEKPIQPDLCSVYDTVSRAKLGITDANWSHYRIERLDDGSSLLHIAPTRILTRGPNKGRFQWDHTQAKTVVLSREEVDREIARREQQSGICSLCACSGFVVIGWSKLSGVQTWKARKCLKCLEVDA